MIAIETKNVTKIYGDKAEKFAALSDVSLKIESGESVAITGKSGSGKSTLMHMLALLDRPTSGHISVGEKDTSKLSPAELDSLRNKAFGFVFQQFFLNANDTVLDNVILPLKIAGVSKKAREQVAHKVLKIVELSDKAKNKANDLSGGQKQRVCIARALVMEPSIIFADEPTGNLDSATGDKIIDLLFTLNKNQGVTLILVTHDADLAKRCARNLVMKDGRLTEKKV